MVTGQRKLKKFEVSIVNDNLSDLGFGGELEIEILNFNGKLIASRTFSSMPAIPALNNTIFEVKFSD